MKMVVLDSSIVNPGDLNWDFLENYGEAQVYEITEPSEVAERCKDADAVFTSRTKVLGETLKLCPNVKLVHALGTGYEMVDLDYCREHGIIVCNNPGYSSESVAQMVFNFLLDLTTDMASFRNAARSGLWTGMDEYKYHEYKHIELAGLSMGLVGCGDIGKRVAQIAMGLGMKVKATTNSLTEGIKDGITYLPLDELLTQSDVVSLHCPLTEKTKGMVDEAFISKMKEGAILINTARGAIVNEKVLYEALKSGRLSAAGLDVTSPEPPEKDNPLLKLDNCIITPHISWATKAARRRLQILMEKNIVTFLSGGEIRSRIV